MPLKTPAISVRNTSWSLSSRSPSRDGTRRPLRRREFARWVPAGTGAVTNPSVELSVKHALDKDAAGPFELFAQEGIPLTVTFGVRNLLDETYRDFLDTYKGYALSLGHDVQLSLSTSF